MLNYPYTLSEDEATQSIYLPLNLLAERTPVHVQARQCIKTCSRCVT